MPRTRIKNTVLAILHAWNKILFHTIPTCVQSNNRNNVDSKPAGSANFLQVTLVHTVLVIIIVL